MYISSSAAVCDVCPCFHIELVLVLPESSVVRVSAADRHAGQRRHPLEHLAEDAAPERSAS